MAAWWAVSPPPESGPSPTRSCWPPASGCGPICSTKWWRSDGVAVVIFIGVWVCALLVWWACSNAFRHSDMDKLKSRLLGSNKPKKAKTSVIGSLMHSDETNTLLALKFLRRFQLQTKLQDLLEQGGMKWTTQKLVNISLG